MALLNRYILIEYDIGGPRLWHERLALEHVSGDTYIVVTPDRDAEELGLLNSDIRHIRVRAAANVDPPGVNAAEIYGLPAWGQNDMNSIRDEARQLAEQERRALHAGGVVAAPPMGAGVGPPAGALRLPLLCHRPLTPTLDILHRP